MGRSPGWSVGEIVRGALGDAWLPARAIGSTCVSFPSPLASCACGRGCLDLRCRRLCCPKKRPVPGAYFLPEVRERLPELHVFSLLRPGGHDSLAAGDPIVPRVLPVPATDTAVRRRAEPEAAEWKMEGKATVQPTLWVSPHHHRTPSLRPRGVPARRAVRARCGRQCGRVGGCSLRQGARLPRPHRRVPGMKWGIRWRVRAHRVVPPAGGGRA